MTSAIAGRMQRRHARGAGNARWGALAVVGVVVLWTAACPAESIAEEKRAVFFGTRKVEDVTEIVRQNRGGGVLVQRVHQRVAVGAEVHDQILSLARLDDEGYAVSGSYRREGPHGKRYTELTLQPRNGVPGPLVFSRGDDEMLALPTRPVVLLETAHLLRAKPGAPREVTLLDLENAVFVTGHIDAAGQLEEGRGGSIGGWSDLPLGTAPPTERVAALLGRAPRADDAAAETDKKKAPFLESDTPALSSFCRQHAPAMAPLDAARALSAAIRPKLAADRAGGPPAALNTLQAGGDADGGAALLVACLRSLGHSARMVCGDDTNGDGVRRHAWAEVFTDRFVAADVDDPENQRPHVARAVGFCGPLTAGVP